MRHHLARGLVAVAALVVASCGSGGDAAAPTTTAATATSTTATTTTTEPSTTTTTTATTGASSGTVLASEAAGTVAGATATLVDYASTALDGRGIVVRGVVVVPDAPPPPGGHPVLTWAHGTTGIADACAPSRLGPGHVPNLAELVAAGFAVVATDYEGLGTEGVHPYLVAESEARSVLDIVTAARALAGPGVVSDTVVIAGHSQGGHAALAAAEWADRVAPELDVVGAVALAPAADLELVVPGMFQSSAAMTFGIYVAASWPEVHPELDAADLLTEAGLDVAAAITEDACVGETFARVAAVPVEELVATSPADDPDWRARIETNTIHVDRIDVPVLVVQGGADPLVPEILSDALVASFCDAGATTGYLVEPDADHVTIVGLTAEDVVSWALDRVAGVPAPSDC